MARPWRLDAFANGVGLARLRSGRPGGLTRRDAAVRWLAENQRADGGWDEEHFTGTGFPRDFLINYHLYRMVWPVWALGRVREALRR